LQHHELHGSRRADDSAAAAAVRVLLSSLVKLFLPARCALSRHRQRHDADHQARRAKQRLRRCQREPRYFSPSVLLGREGLALKDFFNAFPVAAWQGQIDAVLSGGIDATMVYEDVWLAQPSNAERTKILARLDDLPTPPFIVRTNMDELVVGQLKQTLLGLTTDGKGALYAGFAEFQDARMQRWFADLAALPGLAHAA
jgi:hypothetical protein